MKNFGRFSLMAMFIFSIAFVSFGQADTDTDAHDINITIPEVALLDIEPGGGNTITLGPTAPAEAGLPISFALATDNTLWMNYSSIIGSVTEPSRDVSVNITSGTLPGGMTLTVLAAADAGNGDGTVGTSTATVTLSGTTQPIVTGIGSCYTATGINNGHQLTYTLDLGAGAGSYALLDFDDVTTIEVTYTISDL